MPLFVGEHDTGKEVILPKSAAERHAQFWHATHTKESSENKFSTEKILYEPLSHFQREKRICGLRKRWVLLIIGVAVVVIIAAAVGGGVAASKASKSNSDKDSQSQTSSSGGSNPSQTNGVSGPSGSPNISAGGVIDDPETQLAYPESSIPAPSSTEPTTVTATISPSSSTPSGSGSESGTGSDSAQASASGSGSGSESGSGAGSGAGSSAASSQASPQNPAATTTPTAKASTPTTSAGLPPNSLATTAPDGSLLGINPCPGANNSKFTPANSPAFTEFCNADWLINTPSQDGSQTPTVVNLDIVVADSFHMCINQCATWNEQKGHLQYSCQAVSYRWNITDAMDRLDRPGNCILKTARGKGLPPTGGQAHVAVMDSA